MASFAMRTFAFQSRNIARFHSRVPRTSLGSTSIPVNRSYATNALKKLATGHLPHLQALSLSQARDPEHGRLVSTNLERFGLLRIGLGFQDDCSEYLISLLRSLHKHHNHELPISHSATRGWFWDVRPSSISFQTENHQARSETMYDFPWHTDCSYENFPPRYFALQVLQHDRFGGGTLSAMNVSKLSQFLSPRTRAALKLPAYRILTPTEFIKDPTQTHIVGPILADSPNGQSPIMRFREDILTPMTEDAAVALEELKEALVREDVNSGAAVHLSPADLTKGSIVLMDNRRWLQARNHIRDPERHLRRVRWDATTFGRTSAMSLLQNSIA